MKTQNDKRAPVSDSVRSITDTGAFLFMTSALAGWLNDAGIRHYHRAQALVIRVFGDELINMLFAIRPGLHYLPLSSCLIAIA